MWFRDVIGHTDTEGQQRPSQGFLLAGPHLTAGQGFHVLFTVDPRHTEQYLVHGKGSETCWMDGWVDRQMDGWMDGQTDGWMDRRMDGWMDGQTDEWMVGQMDRRMDGWMDGLMDGWTDGGMDG